MTTKFWKPMGSLKLIRHPRSDFFAPVNSAGCGVPPHPSTGHLQLLWQYFFQAMRGSTKQLSNWLVRPARTDTVAPRPINCIGSIMSVRNKRRYFIFLLKYMFARRALWFLSCECEKLFQLFETVLVTPKILDARFPTLAKKWSDHNFWLGLSHSRWTGNKGTTIIAKTVPL